MDTDELIKHSRARFDHAAAKRTLKEKYQANDFSNLKIFASHGTADQVIPVNWARKSPAILEGLGIKTTYKEYPIGHGVSPQNFYDLKSWLLEK